jgi:hypothetical protein
MEYTTSVTWLEVRIQNRPQFVRIDLEVGAGRLAEQLAHFPLFVDVVCGYRLLPRKETKRDDS